MVTTISFSYNSFIQKEIYILLKALLTLDHVQDCHFIKLSTKAANEPMINEGTALNNHILLLPYTNITVLKHDSTFWETLD